MARLEMYNIDNLAKRWSSLQSACLVIMFISFDSATATILQFAYHFIFPHHDYPFLGTMTDLYSVLVNFTRIGPLLTTSIVVACLPRGQVAPSFVPQTCQVIIIAFALFIARRIWQYTATINQRSLIYLRSVFRIILIHLVFLLMGGGFAAFRLLNPSLPTHSVAPFVLWSIAIPLILFIATVCIFNLFNLDQLINKRLYGLPFSLRDIENTTKQYKSNPPAESIFRIDRLGGTIWILIGVILFLVGAVLFDVPSYLQSRGFGPRLRDRVVQRRSSID